MELPGNRLNNVAKAVACALVQRRRFFICRATQTAQTADRILVA